MRRKLTKLAIVLLIALGIVVYYIKVGSVCYKLVRCPEGGFVVMKCGENSIGGCGAGGGGGGAG